jgi:HEAT repeat protein
MVAMNKTRVARIFFMALVVAASAASQTSPQPTAQAVSALPNPTAKSEPHHGTAADFDEQAWRVLWLGLHNPRALKRMEAVKALSLMKGNQRALIFALRALNDKNSRVRTAAAATLGDLNASKAIPALKAALSDKEVSVVLAATHALYILKDPAAYQIYYAILMGDKKTSEGLIESQVNRLKDPKQVAEMGFQEGLGFVPFGGMGYEAYRTLMKHDSSPVRAAAARFLALDPDSVSEDALIQTALADKNTIVREAALDALAQRGDPACAERLAKNLDEKQYPVRYRTAATIIRLSNLKPGARK